MLAGAFNAWRGEHIDIITPGCSVLVHQKAGRDPVNWQPRSTRIRYQIEDSSDTRLFAICPYRFKPPEKMSVRFKSIAATRALRMAVSGEYDDAADGTDGACQLMR